MIPITEHYQQIPKVANKDNSLRLTGRYESQRGGAITEKRSTVIRKKKRENKTQHVDWNALRY